MSSLDHDSLLHEGSAPGSVTRSTRTGTAQRSGTATTGTPRRSAAAQQPTAKRPRPTPHPRPAEPVTAGVAAAEAVVDGTGIGTVEDAASLTAAAEEAGRAVVEELADAPVDVVIKDLAPAEDDAPRGRLGHRIPAVLRRRPVLGTATALVTVLGAAAVYAVPAAQADPAEQHSHSMSVAAELGISSQQALEAPDGHDADRLAEIAASRASREADQAAAAQAQEQADAAALAAIAEAQRPKAVLPVNGARLTSTFGSRWGTLHAGIDLAAPIGTPEYAAMDGVVLEAGPASGFGLAVYIQHDNGDVTVYGHMEQILVRPGQVVHAGDEIALLGNRGQSTGPHLHFEVHIGGINGEKVDPIPWLQERGVQVP